MNQTTTQPIITCLPGAAVCEVTASRNTPPVTVTYVTDPICSACWVLEPAWRAMRYRYGAHFDVRYVYGGLVPSWDGFMDAGAGITKPIDVAHHWDEIAEATGQPIDSSVWMTDPIPSSYPPSIAAVAVRLVAPELEEGFLRGLREQLFVHGRNIARPEVWWEVTASLGLPLDDMRARLDDGSAKAEFMADLGRAAASGARGFPTLIFEAGDARLSFHGPQSFARLEAALLTLSDVEPQKARVRVPEAVAFLQTGSTVEYAELLGTDLEETEAQLTESGLQPTAVPGGRWWRISDE